MNQAQSGCSFPVLLFLVFLVLRLTGQIHWSWWWISSPLWITFLLGVTLIGIGVLLERWA